MFDYKLFLSPGASLVLPYFGGTRVDTAERRLRVGPAASLELGWWRFDIDGRRAIPRDRAPPAELGALPAVRGHWTDGWVASSGRELGRIALPPEDEPPPLARVTARRWYSGELLLESIDFEDDAEVSARSALEEGRSLEGIAGVVPSLRAAFAFSLAAAVAREQRVPLSHREIAPYLVAIGDSGRLAVRAILDRMAAEREAARAVVAERLRREAARVQREADDVRELQRLEEEAREAAGREARARAAAQVAYARRRRGDPVEAADAALEAAGARMLSARRLRGSQLEVRFVVDDVRIIAVVQASTLGVIDAGICLAGADREVTLDSLPSVVREAVSTHRLNITRHD